MKRKTNRLIATLLAIVMLVGLMPMSAFAAGPTLIDGLTLDGIAAPVAGESAARNNSVVTGLEGCSINWASGFTQWRGDDYSTVSPLAYYNQKFDYETTYTLSLGLEAEEGYEFDTTATELTSWTLGGVAATAIDMRSATFIVVTFPFPATGEFEGTLIDGLTLGGIAAPVAGESSERDPASITGLEGCTLHVDGGNTGWWIGNSYSNGTFTLWETPKNFEAGSVYSVCLRLNAPEDTRFDRTATATSNWTLNGIEASDVSIYDTVVQLLFTFPATEVGATIENANVILPFPAAGGSATAEEYTTAIIPEDAPYTVSAVTWRENSPTGSIFTGTFTESHLYYPSVTLTPKDAALPFTGVTTLTLNGVSSNDKTVEGGEMTVQKGFMSAALGTATLGNIEIATAKVGYGNFARKYIPFSVTSAASLKNAVVTYSGDTDAFSGIYGFGALYTVATGDYNTRLSVTPGTGLSAGTYTLTVTLTADNLAMPVTSTVTFTVEPVIFTYRPSAEDTTGEFTETITEPGAHTPPACPFEAPAGQYFKSWQSLTVGSYPFTPNGKDRVLIPVFSSYEATVTFHENGGTLTGENNVIEASGSQYVQLPSAYGITAPADREFLYWAVGSPDSDIHINAYEYYYLTSNDDVDIYAVWSGTKEATPTEVSFVGTGYDTGKLTGVSAGLKYQIGSGEIVSITSNEDVVLSGLAWGDVIKVWRLGNGTTTIDSDKVSFTLERGGMPMSPMGVKCTTLANNDGQITGVDSTMEYQKEGDTEWIAITGSTVTGLTNGIYYVRWKGDVNTLASESKAVNIVAFIGSKEPTPISGFTATGSDCGTLDPTSAGMVWYTSDDPTEHSITGSTASVTGLTGACTIYVVKKGNGTTTYDSDPKEITVTKAEAYTPTMTPCTTAANNDGTLFVPTFAEYKLMPDGAWTSGTGELAGLTGGSVYKVRKAAYATMLASDEVTVTIGSFTAIESFHITYEGFAAPTADGDIYRANNFVLGSELFTLAYSEFYPVWVRKSGESIYDFATLSDDSGTVTFAGETVYALGLYLTPKAGCGFDEANLASYQFNNMVPFRMTRSGSDVILYYAFPLSSMPKQATPAAAFTASGYDCGTLTGTAAGQKYSLDGGLTWTLIEGTSVNIASGISPENGIKVYLPGVAEASTDSDIQTIMLSRAVVPETVKAYPCTTAAGTDGRVTGVTSAMEYKIGEGAWTNGTGADIADLAVGTTVTVRVKASGTTLASAEKTFTIAAFTVISELNVTYEGFVAPAENGSSYRANSFVAGTGYRVNYGQSKWKTYNGSTYPDFKYLDDNGAEAVFAGETVYYLRLMLEAEIGFGFDAENGESYKFNNMTPVDVSTSGGGSYVYLIYKFPATSMATQPTPTATFEAKGYDNGKLSDVKSGMKYSIDGGTTWTLIEGTSVSIASGITPENGIKVYMPGVAEESTDSDIQTITITRATVTGVSAVQPTAMSGEGMFGSIVGFNAATMEYSEDDGASWSTYEEGLTSIAANTTVLVHVKASGTALQSDNATFTILPFGATKEETPTEVSFNATDLNKGVLTGVSAGLRYHRSDMAYSFIEITSTDDIEMTILGGNVITVWRVGNGTTTLDSDPVTFTLTKAATPTGVVGVRPTTAANNDGKLTGVDSTMEYKLSSDAAWTAITGTEVTGLMSGSYQVRVKGSGTVLASDYVLVEVEAYVELPKAATPTALFRATGENEGFIWQVNEGVTYEWYTSLDSTRHTATPYDTGVAGVTSTRFDITGLTEACTIYVVRKGNGTTTVDSDPKEITVGKATQLTKEDIFDHVSTWPEPASMISGIIDLGTDIEKWNDVTSTWQTTSGMAVSFDWGESLTLRRAPSGSTLASEPLTFSIVSETQINKTGEVSLSLTQGFKFNYYVTMTSAEVAAAEAVITFRGNTYSATPTISGFVFEEVTPQYLGETVNAKLYIGGLLVYEVSCSVKSYLEAVTAADPTNAELQTLANDILVYGGAAQNYVGYKTSELVSEGIVGTTFVPLVDRVPAQYNPSSEVSFKAATVHFNNTICLKLRFVPVHANMKNLHVSFRGEEISFVADGEGGYIITTSAIYASEITKSFLFTANDGVAIGLGNQLSYGVPEYVYAMQDREDAMGDLARALWNYGLAAAAYAASLES